MSGTYFGYLGRGVWDMFGGIVGGVWEVSWKILYLKSKRSNTRMKKPAKSIQHL